MKSKLNLILLVLSLLLITTIIVGVILYFQKQNLQTNTPTPTSELLEATPPTPTFSGAVTFEDCGTQNTKSKFSLNLPEKWTGTKTQNFNENYQGYLFNGPEGWVSITCLKSFTAGPCDQENQKTITINGTTTSACIKEAGEKIELSFADLKSPNGNIFDFSANLTNKSVLGQILTSFKF